MRRAVLISLVLVALGACGPAPETVIVQETKAVAGTAAVVEEAVMATAEPEPAEVVLPETPPASAPEAESEGLWYPIPLDPVTLDMQVAGDDISWLIISQLIESLFEYRGDGSIEPTGATGFEVSDDGLVYTIRLRPEAVWSDGEPVVAQHYVDGVLRLLDPETEAEYAWLMYDVEGAEAFNAGETDDPVTVGVRAVDDHTLEVRLAAPAAYFETILPFDIFSPIRLDIIEEHGEQWTEPGNYLSNGPYLLDAWEHGERVALAKNPAYWNASAVRIDKINLPVVVEEGATLPMYEKGELHSTASEGLAQPELWSRIEADPVLSQEVRVLPRPGVWYVGLNTLRPPTDDVLVRKALASAIDRQAFIQKVSGMPWRTPLSCTTPPKIMGHQPHGTCGHAFDAERARAYLAEAGYPDGEGFPPLQVWINWGDRNETAIEAITAMWEEHLGISAEMRIYDYDRYLDYLDGCHQSQEALAACEVNAHMLGWVMDYGDAQNQLEVVFAPYSPFQYTGWQSERYEELMALAATEFDAAQRAQYYKEADKILCEDEVAVIPIYSYAWAALVKEGVTFEFPPFGQPKFKHWALP